MTYNKFEDFFLDHVNKLKNNYNSLPNAGRTMFKNDILEMFNKLSVSDQSDFEINYDIDINKINFSTKRGLQNVIHAIDMHKMSKLLESANI